MSAARSLTQMKSLKTRNDSSPDDTPSYPPVRSISASISSMQCSIRGSTHDAVYDINRPASVTGSPSPAIVHEVVPLASRRTPKSVDA